MVEGRSSRMRTNTSTTDHAIRQQINNMALVDTDLPWVSALRENALHQFENIGFPTSRIEDWKYINLKNLQRQTFNLHTAHNIEVAEEDISSAIISNLDVYRVVFVDGMLDTKFSQLHEISRNANITSLKEQLGSNDMEIEPHLAKYAGLDHSGFVALNTALMRDGIYIQLPKDVKLEKPIHLIYISTAHKDATWHHLRNLIIAEPNSQASVIESYISLGDSAYFNNITTELSLAENTKLAHYKIQQESTHAFNISLLKIRQQQNSQFVSSSISIGGKLSRNEIHSELAAPGCECMINGLYIADGRQQVDTLARVDHLSTHGVSRENFKGIVNDKAKAIFRGIANVHTDAQHTDAEQKNNNLLLSPQAEVDTKPQLEIYADDVKCTHGATVGQLDEDALFYLRSRGIEKETARGLLTYSFAKEIINQISIASLAKHIDALTKNVLPGAQHLEYLQ